MLLPIHIAAGGLAIVLGAVALSVKKGGTVHRRSGLLFVCAMLVMGTTASILGFRKSPTDPNVFTGLLTGYFVGTALTTVRPVSTWTRRINAAVLAIPIALALGTIMRGVEAFNSPRGFLNGVPVPDALLPRHRPDPGGGWRRAHHAIRHTPRPPSVARARSTRFGATRHSCEVSGSGFGLI